MRITEIYQSIQGESSYAGLPCVFVRTTGCDLRCEWCDSEFAFTGGTTMSVDRIVERVGEYGCRLVELTGGEPLLQHDIGELSSRLCDLGYTVLVETGGHRDIDLVDLRAIRIMDIKCPGSGECLKVDWANMDRLRPSDEVKFVLSSRQDYEWARDVIRRYGLEDRVGVLISTVFTRVEPREVVEWMLGDGLRARFQLQLHKFIWPPDERGV